ncbi:MAG: hypothetical protein JWR69_3674, partial [Pedosphaera sp.]|nr:hypothetical protein [Pedosphaera sp.]
MFIECEVFISRQMSENSFGSINDRRKTEMNCLIQRKLNVGFVHEVAGK